MRFSKISEGKVTQALRDGLIVLFMAISFMSFSQTDLITTGYFTVYQNGRFISQHTLQAKADAKLFNLQEQYPDSLNEYIPPTNVRAVGYLKVIDTLQVIGTWSNWGENQKWFRLINGADMLNIESDTVYHWQTIINVKRTKQFAKTSYKDLGGMPFQFVKDSIVQAYSNSVKVRTFATEFHGVKYYVDNVLEFDYSDLDSGNPGQAIIYSYPVWRHTHIVKGLEPNRMYKLRVEGNALDGSINYIEFEITTLKL